MAGPVAYLRETVQGGWSLAAGMWVTLRYLLRRPVTVQYPRARMPLPEAFRGHIELVPVDGGHACVACGECCRTCPSGVIKVQGHKARADAPNRARFFVIDFSRCSLCGLCVEVCTQEAIRFSREYEQAGASRHLGTLDLVRRLQEGERP